MDEIIDVVDDDDRVIGQQPKRKCHQEKILHRNTFILAFKDASFKKLLLHTRSKNKEVKPGKICCPGGHLQTGETYLQGAIREFCEEMYNKAPQKNVRGFDALFKIKKTADEDYEFVTLFRTVAKGPFKPDPKEVDNYFFEDIVETIRKIQKENDKYTETTILLINEYKNRFM